MTTLQDLTKTDQIPVGMTLDGLAALHNQQQQDQITLQELARKSAHEAEMDPLRVQQQQLSNMRSGQLLGEGEYSLASAGRKDASERMLFGPIQEAKLKELLVTAKDSEAKLFEQQLYEKMRSARPGSPEHGALMQALEKTRGFIEEKRKTDQKIRELNTTGWWQRTINQDNIDAGKYRDANAFKTSFDYALSKADSAIKINSVLTRYMAIAQSDPNYASLIPTLNAMLERNKAPYDLEMDQRRRQGVGGVDVGTVTGLPTIPPKPSTAGPLPVPGEQPAPTTVSTPKTIDDAKKAGWKLMKDAKGNSAYVGPNGQFIEVK